MLAADQREYAAPSLFFVRLLNRIGTTGVTEMKHEVLDRFLGAVDEVVPPADAPIVHEGLPRRVVLCALDPDRPRLVLADQCALDDEDVRGDTKLLAPSLPAGSQLDGSSGDVDRCVHRGRERAERGHESLDRDALR